MSRAQLTSTVEQNTGGAVSPYVAGKNKIINGDFGIWQRGTSFATGINGYVADRWVADTCTGVTRDTGTGALPYSLKIASTTGYGNAAIRQGIELPATGNAGVFQVGTTWTISYWSKSSSSSSFNMAIYLAFNDGVNSGTNAVTVASSVTLGAISTSWTKYTYTFTIAASPVGTNTALMVVPYGSTGASSSSVWFTGLQLEAGSVATPFTTATGTLSGELAACMRYYQVVGAGFSGFNESASYMAFAGTLAVPMRATPTLGLSSTALSWFNYGIGTTAVVISQIWGPYVSASSGFAIELQIASGNTSTAKMALQMTNNYTASAEL